MPNDLTQCFYTSTFPRAPWDFTSFWKRREAPGFPQGYACKGHQSVLPYVQNLCWFDKVLSNVFVWRWRRDAFTGKNKCCGSSVLTSVSMKEGSVTNFMNFSFGFRCTNLNTGIFGVVCTIWLAAFPNRPLRTSFFSFWLYCPLIYNVIFWLLPKKNWDRWHHFMIYSTLY